MEEYKKIGKDIEEITSICIAALKVISDSILGTEKIDMKAAFRIYSSYSTSLNLLTGYSSSWNYKRKKTALLAKHKKSDKTEEYFKKAKDNFSKLLHESATHLEILHNSLDELSKMLGGSVENEIENLAAFLKEEAKKLEGIALPNITSGKKVGAGEEISSWREQIQNTLKNMHQNYDSYEVIIGGDSGYIGGVEATQDIKRKVVKLHNIKKDIEDGTYKTQDYYEDIFLPTVESITVTNGTEKEILEALINKTCQSSREQLNTMIKTHDPKKRLQEQLDYITSKELPKLFEYYISRKKDKDSNKSDFKVDTMSISCPALQINEALSLDDPIRSSKIIFHVIKKIVKGIDTEDSRIVEDVIAGEFAQYNKSKHKGRFDDLLSELEENFHILTDNSVQPTKRHEFKKNYKQLMSNLEDLFEAQTENNPNIPKVNPCVKVSELLALNVPDRVIKVQELAAYYISLESALVPFHQKIESHSDSIANLLGQIVSEILRMADVKNKYTCILRTSLLITSLIRCHILPILSKDVHVSEICEKVKATLLENYPASIDTTDKWYRPNKGLSQKILKNIMTSYVL